MYVAASTANPLGQRPWGFQTQNSGQDSLQGLGCNACKKTPMAWALGRMGDDSTDSSFDPSTLFSNPLMLIGLGALAYLAFAGGHKTGSVARKTYRRTRRAVQAF